MATFVWGSKTIPFHDIRKIKNIFYLISNRLIMTSHIKFEKVFEDLQKNPYFSKYSQKIAKLQHTNPEVFSQKIEEKYCKNKEKKENQLMEKQFQATKMSKSNFQPVLQSKEAKLNDIVKLDLIKHKDKEEIKHIWYQYHKQKDCISGVLTREQFEKIFERGKMYNTFLLPLPRENGYEFVMCQFHGTEIHMTPLLWYQTHKENAPECLRMIHYTELMKSKDIVLMKGDFDIKSINVHEAQCLANELQLYYSSDHPQRLKLLQTFMEKPNEFKHMDLITNLETISFDSSNKSIIKEIK